MLSITSVSHDNEISLTVEIPATKGSIFDSESNALSLSIINGISHGLQERVADSKSIFSAMVKH
jgi:hypothetical protein